MALEFKLYVRSTCDLCQMMEQELLPFIEKYAITIHRQYIDNQPELERRFGSSVPVLMKNEAKDESIVCEYFLDTGKLLQAIEQNVEK